MIPESPVTEAHLQRFNQRLALMKLIHLALVAGVVMFGAVAFVVTRDRMTFDLAFQEPLFIASVAAVVAGISAAAALPRVFFSGGAATNVDAAVQKYQVFCIVRAAVVESAALVSAVAVLITYNILPIGPLVLCALALAAYRPSQGEFIRLMRGTAGRAGGVLAGPA